MNGKLRMKQDLNGLSSLAKRSPEAFRHGQTVGGIQLLTWANTGSKNTSATPPIRWGVLRGSSSVLLGGKLVKIFNISIAPEATEEPTPATSHTADNTTLTFVWNTDYALDMHEWTGGWGEATIRANNAGAKWLEKHLDKDRNDLMRVIATETKKKMRI